MRPKFGVPLTALALLFLACARGPTGPNDTTWYAIPGHVEHLSFADFRNGRDVWVYLPPGYALTDRRYPVLYVQDGEYAFDANQAAHIQRICEALIRRGEIEPVVVVAIANGSTPQRWLDYTPYPDFYATRACSCGGGGDAYVRAVRDSLKPQIDRRYRTKTGFRDTGMAGFSLGGEIAVYAGFLYDDTFGRIAGFSPSYWVGRDSLPRYVAQLSSRPPGLVRFYQDTGSPRDNWIEDMTRAATRLGFRLGVDFFSITVPEADHTVGAMEHRFADMMRFLFPRGGI